MKKIISFLLLISLLIVPLSSCELLDSILPDAPDETTTPEATTSENTTPNDTDVTVPSDNNADVTPPNDTDATTPADNTDVITPPEDNSDVTQPGDEVQTFTAKPFFSKKNWGTFDSVEFTVDNEEIVININNYLNNALYQCFYVENVECVFPDEITWYVDANKQVLEAYEKLKNSKSCYMLKTSQRYSLGFNPAIVYHIDGIYYFVIPFENEARVKSVYYVTDSEIKLTLSDKNTIPFYPEIPIQPPTPSESDPLVLELFGEGPLEFSPVFFAQSTSYSSEGDKEIRVTDGNLYIFDYWYEVSYVENADIKYYDEYSCWGVEENETNLAILDAIKSSTSYYMLVTQAENAWYQQVAMVEIDDVYYFLELTDFGRVRRIHYALLEQES